MHSIKFENRENDWKNALPLGNGVLGAMAYFNENILHLPINHYEVYYNKSENVLPKDILKSTPPAENPGAGRLYHRARADRNQPKENEPFLYYRKDKQNPNGYFVGGFDGSYPQTGELAFEFLEKWENHTLSLQVEKAKVDFEADNFSANIRILRKDAILTEFEGKKLSKVNVIFSKQRSRDLPEIEYKEIDKTTFAYTVKMALSENKDFSFAGVFSSNRLDLGKVFSDGLLSYVNLAKRFAKDFHGYEGAAIDYPYAMYYSTWPWCAQYLWAQYEYSIDMEYLRNEAYPLFLELCKFSLQLFEFDEKRGEYVVYPDISPEQGPLAHNTVITVASVKYMLKFTLQAAEILNDNNEILSDIKYLYEHLPQYPTVIDDYGERFIDSEDAPKNLWIRHPSMLMPIFPTGENAENAYHTALDAFTRDWYLGNVRMENHNVYKFDFGKNFEKDYSSELIRQAYSAEEMDIGTMAFNRLDNLEFTEKRGFGFSNAECIKRVDRGAPDLLRRDFLEGEEKVSFIFDAPKGQYELFVVSGDEKEESVTLLNCDEGMRAGGDIIKAGNYQCEVIPLIHKKDGNIKLDISTQKGKKWKLNYILVNLYKQM